MASYTSGDGALRRRIAVRVAAYGYALVALSVTAASGHLARPGLPLLVAAGGLLFSMRTERFPRVAAAAATVYDALAALLFALVLGSWVLGGLAVIVAAATITVVRRETVAAPALVTASTAAALLVLFESGLASVPSGLPAMDEPAATIVAAGASLLLTAVGIGAIRRLTADYAHAAEEAAASTRRWWDLVETATRAMVIERDGRIAHANPAAAVVLGRSVDALAGQDLDALVANDTDTALEVVRSPVNLSGRPATLTVITDRTDIRTERRRLEQLVEDKDRFLATVSHEVRTPLTAVVGLAAAIEQEWQTLEDAERSELISLLVQQSQEMAMIIDDLTVAARSSGAIAVSKEVVSLAGQVEQVAAGLDLGGKQLSISDDAKAIADPYRTRQVIRNLLTNAVRYGGPTIRVTMEGAGDEVRMHVDDDGTEIPEALREAIFEPYRQAHDDPRTAPASMGLGLAVSRQLAELMGGSLRYFRAGSWNRFELELPGEHR